MNVTSCALCKARFKMTTEEEASVKMLECSHCPKEFKFNSERIRHELSHEPRFECESCCKKFSFISALRRHRKQHERTGSVKCVECDRKFRDEILLKRHMKYAHTGTYTCSKCSSTFNSDQALKTHTKTHQPVSERRFKCSYHNCKKTFNFSHHLKHHELTHTNAKQHYCSVCGKGFIQSHHLKDHMKSHDPSEWLLCGVDGCKKKFSTEYARKRHMATHKNKPDSGISSDSNSCDASFTPNDYEDTTFCASCGENVPQMDYTMHFAKCNHIPDISNNSIESCADSNLKPEIDFTEVINTPKSNFNRDISGCNAALGGCIVNGKNCICAQISKPTDENYDFTPIENSNETTAVNSSIENEIDFTETVIKNLDYIENKPVIVKIDSRSEFIDAELISTVETSSNNETVGSAPIVERTKLSLYYNKQLKNAIMCESCGCASNCNKDPSNCNPKIKKDISNIEYRVDGVIKIKDAFDIDIPIKVEEPLYKSQTREVKAQKFVPFSTCKDVIGNCLVGGNGDGCLCVRMMMDDQQAMAQEIDDITPHPKSEHYKMP